MDPLYLQDPIKPAATPQAAKGLRDAINNDSPMMSGFVSGTYGYGGSSLLGLLFGIIGLAGVSSSPYVSGSLTAMLILAVVINGVIAVVLGYIGIQVHKGIQKIATGQF